MNAYPYPFTSTQGKEFILDIPCNQVIWRLNTIKSRPIVKVANPQRLTQLPCTEVRTGYVAHLALVNQVVQGAQCLLCGSVIIWQVGIIEVDIVCFQSA